MQPRRRVIAHHLILSSYGFWLANDPRGSGSSEIRQRRFEELGPIHPGRKREQPTRAVLRAFYEQATPLLDHMPLWFDERIRGIIGASFGEVVGRHRYQAWACFVGSNHCHLCVRTHRDDYQAMWWNLAGQARDALVSMGFVDAAHPVWADRPYSVYLDSEGDIWRTVKYVEENASKEGLAVQRWGFVVPYRGWPWSDRKRGRC